MLTDLLGGQVDFCVVALGAVQQYIKSGSLRAIGTPSKERSPFIPDVPTFREQGLPNYLIEAWYAAIGPKGLSRADVTRIRTALVDAFNTTEVKDAMAKQGNTMLLTTPEQAQAFFKAEFLKFASIVKKAGVEPI
jgi:tripartite-type tricarboxylate transporter receptor subunit TctC